MIEHETFFTLVRDVAHWEFEVFVTLIVEGLILGMFYPFARKHWHHHLNRDARDQIAAQLHTEECPWCHSLKTAHSDIAWQAHQNFANSGRHGMYPPPPIFREHASNCPCDVCGLKRAGQEVHS